MNAIVENALNLRKYRQVRAIGRALAPLSQASNKMSPFYNPALDADPNALAALEEAVASGGVGRKRRVRVKGHYRKRR
jgi:hypothetical protein